MTGSCHLLQAAGKNILMTVVVDAGDDLYEKPGDLPLQAAREVDYVFLTHAHIDLSLFRSFALFCARMG